MDKRFRYIWIVEPGHDFSSLRNECEKIRFMSTGNEEIEELSETFEKVIENFEPQKDAIVAVGRVNSCLFVGAKLHHYFEGLQITLGIYQAIEGRYQWQTVRL